MLVVPTSTFQFSLWDSPPGFRRRRNTIRILSILFMRFFNEDEYLETPVTLSILFMRFGESPSLDQSIYKDFQFSLWDSMFEVYAYVAPPALSILFMRFRRQFKRRRRSCIMAFNSLYEILSCRCATEATSLMKLSILFMRFLLTKSQVLELYERFQFSLWDSEFPIPFYRFLQFCFQFSLWDSFSQPSHHA